MKKTLLVFAMALLASSLLAQSRITGSLIDKTGTAVGFATVILNNGDGSLNKGISADADGKFQLDAEAGKYDLTISLIGYQNSVRSIVADGKTSIDLGNIVLEEDSMVLGEAIVKAVIPKTVLTGEGMQTSVRGTLLENAGTANDVLAKTPGLIKGKDGLEVVGKGSPQIYINGRKVTDSGELDRLQSEEIQSVEVITNPGAQYDASIRSVVRIRTIRRQGDGFGFTAGLKDEQSLRYAGHNDPSVNISTNYRVRNVDVFAGGDFSRDTYRQDSDKIWQKTLGNPVSVQDGSLFADGNSVSYNLNGGVNWQIADNHSVGFKVEYQSTVVDIHHQELLESLKINDSLADSLKAVGDYRIGAKVPRSLNSNIYYNGKAGKLGIDLNLDYYGTVSSRSSITEEKSLMPGGSDATISTGTGADSRIWAGKLILSYPVWKGSLQLGTENTFTRRSDSYTITGAGIPSSETAVKENNIAAFAGYAFYLPKFGQANLGLRYEHVFYRYDDYCNPSSNIERKYDNIFPSVSYANVFGPVQLMANYSAKTARPGFYQLSSAINYNSRYLLQSGNASLQPMQINDVSLSAKWKCLVLTTGYSRTDNCISVWSSRYNDEGVVMVKPRNLETPFRQMNVILNATPTGNFWNLNAVTGIIQQWLDIPYSDGTSTRVISFNDKPMFFARLLYALKAKGGWQFELGGEYHTPGYSYNVEIVNHYFDLTAAIQKTLLKDGSLVLRLEGNDLANTGYFNVYTDFGTHIIIQNNMMDTQRLKLSLKYKFNSAASKYKGQRSGQDVAERIKK